MMMMTESDKMTNKEQLKAELERYFTAVVDEQYLKQYPDVTSPVGTPMFYDERGEIDAEYISEMTGMSPSDVRTSFEAWKGAGGTPPHERSVRSGASENRQTPLSRPKLGQIEIPERKQSGSLLSEIRDDMNDALEFRRLEQQFDSMDSQPSYQGAGGATSDLTAVITALAPLLKQDRPSIDPMTMTLMKQLNDRTNDSTSQMIALFNMNQQANQQWMTMLMENMRGGGSRSSLEDRLLNHSLDRMLTGGDSPEESFWGELVKSGQLGEIAQGVTAGIAGIANRRAPMGENPYANPPAQEALPEPVGEAPAAEQLAPTFEAPEREPTVMTTQEKYTHIMNEMMPTLPDEWTSDGNTMQMLMNSVEISVRRAEDTFPTSVEMQLAQAAKEMLVIANLRTLGTSLNKIEKGEIAVDLASTILSQHPLWPVFQSETADSILMMVNAYAAADLEDSPSLVHDLEYLNRPTTRPIIESLLDKARGGAAE